jgi:hypothetical protein
MPQLRVIGQPRITYCVGRVEDKRKLFQTMFLRDGTLTVHFPYLRDTSGMLAVGEMPAGHAHLPKLRVGGEEGRCTSHQVKYSHHIDGRAHFSQDGRVYTTVKRQAVPLRNANGHVFTIKMQNLEHFKLASEKDLTNARRDRKFVNFELPENCDAVQFIGSIYSYTNLQSRFQRPDGQPVGPTIDLLHPARGVIKAIAAMNQKRPNDDTVLVVSAEAIPSFSNDETTSIIFTGGFDHRDIVYDHSRPSGFLFMACPYSLDVAATNNVANIDIPSSSFPKKPDVNQ